MPKIRDVRKLFAFAACQPLVRVRYDLESAYQEPWDIADKLISFSVERSNSYPFDFCVWLNFQHSGIRQAHGLIDFSRCWLGLAGESDLGSLSKLHVLEPGKPLYWSRCHCDELSTEVLISREMKSYLNQKVFR